MPTPIADPTHLAVLTTPLKNRHRGIRHHPVHGATVLLTPYAEETGFYATYRGTTLTGTGPTIRAALIDLYTRHPLTLVFEFERVDDSVTRVKVRDEANFAPRVAGHVMRLRNPSPDVAYLWAAVNAGPYAGIELDFRGITDGRKIRAAVKRQLRALVVPNEAP